MKEVFSATDSTARTSLTLYTTFTTLYFLIQTTAQSDATGSYLKDQNFGKSLEGSTLIFADILIFLKQPKLKCKKVHPICSVISIQHLLVTDKYRTTTNTALTEYCTVKDKKA